MNYGKAGAGDRQVIDGYLRQLRPGSVVVNLGCGPNVTGELDLLAASMRRFQSRSTLIFADLHADVIQNQAAIVARGPEVVRFEIVNAGKASEYLGVSSVDLIIALGLFGDLARETSDQGVGQAAWPIVLIECYRCLRPGGHLIVSNSVERQLFSEFRLPAAAAGFEVLERYVAEAVAGQEKSKDQRYLVVLQRRMV